MIYQTILPYKPVGSSKPVVSSLHTNLSNLRISDPVEANQPASRNFMGLPVDVRLLILESLFEDLELGTSPHRYAKFHGKWADDPLAILLACRQLYHEGRKPYFDKTQFKARAGMTFATTTYDLGAAFHDPAADRARRLAGMRTVGRPLSRALAFFAKRYTIELKGISIPDFDAYMRAAGRDGIKTRWRLLEDQIDALVPERHYPGGYDFVTLDMSSWVWKSWDNAEDREQNILYAKFLLHNLYSLAGNVKHMEILGLPGPMKEVGRGLVEVLTTFRGGHAFQDWYFSA